jgi:lysophospholipase L1-like esterase
MTTPRTILAFGDSLTWGYVAGAATRHPFAVRWPNVLAAKLGPEVRVIEEGHNGRLTVHDDPTVNECRNGAVALPILLASHHPLDLVIIMLGSNDLKWAMRQRAFDAARGVARLVEITRRHMYTPGESVPEVLIVAPPALVETDDAYFDHLFTHAIAESRLFGKWYAETARELGCHFFDAASVAVADPVDGIHLDAANTIRIGEALAAPVRSILKL